MRFKLKYLFITIALIALILAFTIKTTVTVRCNYGPGDLSGHQGIRAGETVNIYGKLPAGKFVSVATDVVSASGERIEFEDGCIIAYIDVAVPCLKTFSKDKYTNYAVEFVRGPFSRNITQSTQKDMLDILNEAR